MSPTALSEAASKPVASEAAPLLAVTDLAAGYGDVQVLWGVDLSVPQGAIATLVGPNGAGKTTLLLAISGLVPVSRGSIRFDGRDITGARPADIVQAGIIHVPEGRRLFRTLSVRDNLMLGAYCRTDGDAAIARDLDRVFSIFPILAARSGQDATTMSGGEQQMCAIGRGIMARPRLLLIDELSLGLAPRAVELLADSLLKINAEGISVLLVEQDVMVAFELASLGYVLESGRVRMYGPTDMLMNDTTMKRAYMGL